MPTGMVAPEARKLQRGQAVNHARLKTAKHSKPLVARRNDVSKGVTLKDLSTGADTESLWKESNSGKA